MFVFEIGACWVNLTRSQQANKWKQSAIQKQNSFNVQTQIVKTISPMPNLNLYYNTEKNNRQGPKTAGYRLRKSKLNVLSKNFKYERLLMSVTDFIFILATS